MAILSKIRDRSLALIAVIGLALFAFVLDPSTLGDFFDSVKVNEVGEVDGETISRQDFAEAIDSYNARTNGRLAEMQVGKTVWDNLLREKIYTKQLEDAGVTIGETDVWNKIISTPSVASSPQFANELGLFDENKFKQFIVDAQQGEDQNLWKAWNNYMNQLGTDLKRDTYTNLVNAGLGASLKEGEYQYNEDNTLMNADLVYIPYTSIPDSLIQVSKADVEKYIKANPLDNQVEASRDITYVKFDITPTDKDKEDIKNEVGKFLEDRQEFNKVTKSEGTVLGLKNTTDYLQFFDENKSDVSYEEVFFMKTDIERVPNLNVETVLAANVGDTFGPYEDRNFFKISKVTEVIERPDSVKSSHILIPFIGSPAAIATTTKTVEQAKVSADSIFRLVRNSKKKFAEIADEVNADGSKGKGGEIGWTPHNVGFSPRFDEDYAKFIFDNREGKIEVVKTKFGYHIIRIDEQRNKQKGVKLVTFGRQIEPSQDTENTVFQNAEKFALAVSEKKSSFLEVASNNKYTTRPAVGLKVLEDKVPGILGTNRQVIIWAFNKDTEIDDIKRFDIDNGYIVAILTAKADKGLINPTKAINKIKPILVNEKKAKLIKDKMTGASLNDIATANKVTVRKVNSVAIKSPSITGVGSEPNVVGAMYYAKDNQLYNKIEGKKGVFAFVLTKKEPAPQLPNYEPFRSRMSQDRKNKAVNIFEALKKAADIEDNRAIYYGIQQ